MVALGAVVKRKHPRSKQPIPQDEQLSRSYIRRGAGWTLVYAELALQVC